MPTQQNWSAPSDKPAAEAEWEWLFCLISTLQLAQCAHEPINHAVHELRAYPVSAGFAARSLLSRLLPIRVGPSKKVDAA